MLFGDAGLTKEEFADEFVQEMMIGIAGSPAPCVGGERTAWSDRIFQVLKQMGQECGYDQCYKWLVDYVWWSGPDENFGLAVESELDTNPREIEDDFYKLTVLKCPLKVLIYSATEPEQMKTRAEEYLRKRGQHVKGEEYLLVAFTRNGAQCYGLTIPCDGRCSDLNFDPLNLRRAQAAS